MDRCHSQPFSFLSNTHTHTADKQPNSKNLLSLKWKNTDSGKTEKFRIVSQITHKWRDLGGLLQIPWSQLECWSKDRSKDDKDCCVAVLNHWLNNPTSDYPATWEGLYELIDDCELNEIAKTLKKATQSAI